MPIGATVFQPWSVRSMGLVEVGAEQMCETQTTTKGEESVGQRHRHIKCVMGALCMSNNHRHCCRIKSRECRRGVVAGVMLVVEGDGRVIAGARYRS